jgi:hypothetical protein
MLRCCLTRGCNGPRLRFVPIAAEEPQGRYMAADE